MDNEPKLLPGTVLLDRMMMIGEGIIPRSSFDKLSKNEMLIWLTEPDPARFPPQMSELRRLLEEMPELPEFFEE